MHEIKAGSTDQTIRFMLTKSDGTPYTGLLYSTPGLKCYYSRQGAASTQITLVDIPSIGTYVSSGFKAVDGTNMPGYYELGIPNAAVVAGAKFVDIMISGPADLYVCPQRIRLTGIDLDDATNAGLSKIAQFEFDGDNNVCSIPMSLSVDVNNMIANGVWLYGTLDELDESTAGGRLFKAQTDLEGILTTYDSNGNIKAVVMDIDSATQYMLADSVWLKDFSLLGNTGDTIAVNMLETIKAATDKLPSSPAAVGSPMTLADDAITAVKVADGALTSAKVTSVGSVVGNIEGSVNNVISGVDLCAQALTAIDANVRLALDDVQFGVEAINTLVTRMMGPGDVLKEFPVFSGSSPSTTPLPGATVWVTSDEAGSSIYAGPQISDSVGMTRWMLTEDVTYYFWCQMPGRTFQNPTEVFI